ncbi:hypothetical protein TanjilG_25288 [Lupinus angustifolius]|uniref:Very-long-chain aldehyde decarbonylase CER1-like C-terminal domain-containing protein n=1 Tax=Lupinus angustifolius TaxID=3871 RepID=A0A4P1RVD1_LUPAN|nr:hypothetical protein TanjilG_25288 [Lupinus angustifolius]
MDKNSDELHESALKREEDTPNVIHLTHFTTPESIYHLRLGFPSLASKPYMQKWYISLMWPITAWSMILTWFYGHTFIVERNTFHKLKIQTWAIPKYSFQYFLEWQKGPINRIIEEAILDADRKGIKVVSLGLMNQDEELNMNGGLYVSKNPKLKVKVVDGSTLAVAIVLNTIPKGKTQVLLRGKLTKVAYAIAYTLCQQGVQVATMYEDDYVKLNKSFNGSETNLIMTKSFTQTTWLVGEDLSEEEQKKAPKGTLFIPYSQFPPKKYRKDCSFHCTPAMLTPTSLENVHSCEGWLPRRVMSAWRIAGIVHSLEGWNENECGYKMHNIDKYFLEWQKGPINRIIEEAILDADRKGIKVVSLGLMNQDEELNMNGGLYVSKNPKLKVKVVDGSTLAVAIVLNTIPKGKTQVLLRGKLTKVAYAIAYTLCQQGVQVATMYEDDYVKLNKSFNGSETNLIMTKSFTQTTWLVGEDLSEEEQKKAPKGTLFIPYSQFPPKKYRKDCSFHCTPAMLTPTSLENVHSCEGWLPRRVMSAWRIAGIVHSLEGWNENECGYKMHNIDKVWNTTIQHGFIPIPIPVPSYPKN